jgi:hypothetical protein
MCHYKGANISIISESDNIHRHSCSMWAMIKRMVLEFAQYIDSDGTTPIRNVTVAAARSTLPSTITNSLLFFLIDSVGFGTPIYAQLRLDVLE